MLLCAHFVVANSLNLIFSEKALLLLLSVLGTQMAIGQRMGESKMNFPNSFWNLLHRYYWIQFTLFQFSFYCFTRFSFIRGALISGQMIPWRVQEKPLRWIRNLRGPWWLRFLWYVKRYICWPFIQIYMYAYWTNYSRGKNLTTSSNDARCYWFDVHVVTAWCHLESICIR